MAEMQHVPINVKHDWELFLDDERLPAASYTGKIARTYEEACALIREFGCPKFISFDHDLGENSKTGMDFAHWMVERDIDGWLDIPSNFKFYVHSQNPTGKKNIEGLLLGYIHFKFFE